MTRRLPTALRALPRSAARGFTLIELMIVVAVIAILASVAYPSYTAYVLRGKRTEGRTALMQAMMDQERYFTQNNTYLAFTAGATGVGFKTFSGDSANKTSYKLSAAACQGSTIAQCVIVSAVPQFSDSEVGSLTITSTGPTRSCTGPAATGNPKACWP